jgi:membrane protein
LARTLARYGEKRGGLLAGGIAYSALFSLAAALTISFSILAAVAGENQELREAVVRAVNAWLPGLLADGGQSGVVDVDQLVRSNLVSWTGAVAGVVLAFSALGFMGALRSGVRAMFGLDQVAENAIVTKVLTLIGFVLLGGAILVSAGLGILASSASRWLSEVLHVPDAEAAVTWIGAGASFLLDTALVIALFCWVAGARPPWKDLLIGAAAAALAAGVMRHLGTRIVARSTANALLAGFASLATILVWINLMARITLYAAAWTANPPPRPRSP